MYKTVNTIFLVILVILVILVLWYEYPWQVILLFIIIFLGVTFLGSYFIQLNYFTHSFNLKKTSEKTVALTFDDGPNSLYTGQILDLLEQFNCKASFFLIGINSKNHPELVKKINENGHTIGHHSYHHNFWFDFYSRKMVIKELQDSMEEVKKIIGKNPILFRPPYGVTNPAIASAIQFLGLYSIGWNIRTMDTVKKDKDAVLRKVKKDLKPGSVILLHDSLPESVEILKGILLYLKKNEYRPVTVDELFNIEVYA